MRIHDGQHPPIAIINIGKNSGVTITADE